MMLNIFFTILSVSCVCLTTVWIEVLTIYFASGTFSAKTFHFHFSVRRGFSTLPRSWKFHMTSGLSRCLWLAGQSREEKVLEQSWQCNNIMPVCGPVLFSSRWRNCPAVMEGPWNVIWQVQIKQSSGVCWLTLWFIGTNRLTWTAEWRNYGNRVYTVAITTAWDTTVLHHKHSCRHFIYMSPDEWTTDAVCI